MGGQEHRGFLLLKFHRSHPRAGNFATHSRILYRARLQGSNSMKLPKAMVVCSVCLLGLLVVANAEAQVSAENRTPVLVELFTSEGCSSCPPADVLLQKLVQLQPVPGAEIIALEEHVDYWNHDGWIDPFSSPEWTQRQQNYVALTNNQSYTPELVVDGSTQFNGSDGPKAVEAIEKASRETKVQVTITPEKNSHGVTVSVGPIPELGKDSAEVWFAITEDGLHSQADAGENKGRTLNHIATLRSLHKIGTADAHKPVSFSGDADVKINSRWNPGNLHVIVFVQSKKSRAILGAASTKLQS